MTPDWLRLYAGSIDSKDDGSKAGRKDGSFKRKGGVIKTKRNRRTLRRRIVRIKKISRRGGRGEKRR